MNESNKLTPAKLWILILITTTVITLLVFTGIKLFNERSSISTNNSPHSYTFASNICNVSYDTQSELFVTDEKCWNTTPGSKVSWYMICNSPKIGDFRRAVEVRVFFFQGKYSHIYAFDLMNKKMNYNLKDFSSDLKDKRITECLYQYPMKIDNK